MKEIQLTQGQFALVDDADYDFLMQWKWYAHKMTGNFYAARRDRKHRKLVFMHRMLLGLDNLKILGDHIDTNSLNNQRGNLRQANFSQSLANRKSYKNSLSKYKGVYWCKNVRKWRAKLTKNRISIHIGLFENELEAAKAYNERAKVVHGEFACLNTI